MIKCSKITIGSNVCYNGGVYVVEGILEDRPILDGAVVGIEVGCWSDLDPIPITYDWLFKLGFRYNKWFRCYFGHGFKLEDRNKSLNKFPVANQPNLKDRFGVFYADGDFIANILYVHELQGIINLLGFDD